MHTETDFNTIGSALSRKSSHINWEISMMESFASKAVGSEILFYGTRASHSFWTPFNPERQKQPPVVFYIKSCSWKFCCIHRKTPMLKSFFSKVAGLQVWNFIKMRLQHRCFPVNIAKFFIASILKNTCERLLLKKNWISIYLR